MSLKRTFKLIISILLFAGVLIGVLYLGVLFERATANGYSKLVKDQGINVFFGVLGGLITTGVLAYLKSGVENFRVRSKQDRILTGTWDEYYIPTEFVEQKQEQCLVFRLKHDGEKIIGTLTGNDNPDYTDLPKSDKHGLRLFDVHGRQEGNLISMTAIIDSDEEVGHTVYLLEINHQHSILEGITIYYDQTERVLTTAKSKLVKRRKTVKS